MVARPQETGITVVVCDGHRCRALRGRTDTGVGEGEAVTLLGALRERIRRSRHGVLIRSGCLGACERAPVVLVILRGGSPTGVLRGPVEEPGHVRALLEAVGREGV